MDSDNLIRKPFERQKEEKVDVFTIRLNTEERAWLEQAKEYLNIKSDSKTIKLLAFIGKNVLHNTFSAPLLKYLFKKERQKLEDFKDF